jgi:hypothetical protein
MMRVGKALQLEPFRSVVTERGAVFEVPSIPNGEVMRFRIGNARGVVTQRADGSFTLITIAADLYREFQKTEAIL